MQLSADDISASHTPSPARLGMTKLNQTACVLENCLTAVTSEKHKVAGARYAGIRLRIEEILALPSDLRGNVAQVLDSVRSTMDKLAEESPGLPPWSRWTKSNAPFDTKDEKVAKDEQRSSAR